MKVVKVVLIVLGILIAIPLIAALFIKKDFAIEKEIIINKPKTDVFNYILMLKNQDHFSKWGALDPNMKKTYAGTDGTVGFIAAWESDNKKVGKGAQEIQKIAPGDRIDYELRFEKPMRATNYAYLATESVSPTQTRVKWGFYGKMQYPFNFISVIMNMDQMLGDDLNIGLTNLKGVMEKQ